MDHEKAIEKRNAKETSQVQRKKRISVNKESLPPTVRRGGKVNCKTHERFPIDVRPLTDNKDDAQEIAW